MKLTSTARQKHNYFEVGEEIPLFTNLFFIHHFLFNLRRKFYVN